MMRSHLIDIREAHRLNKERCASIDKVASRHSGPPRLRQSGTGPFFLVAQPPLLTQEGNSDSRFASTTDLRTKREVEDKNLHTPDVALARRYSTVIVASFLRA